MHSIVDRLWSLMTCTSRRLSVPLSGPLSFAWLWCYL